MLRFRKILTTIIILILFINLAWSEEKTEKKRFASINFVLMDSIAFAGLGAEIYLGNLGIGGVITALPLGANNNYFVPYEVEFYGRFYLGNLSNSLFIAGNVGYFSIFGSIQDNSFNLTAGLLNLSPSVGYNVFFGGENNARFAIELGPRITKGVSGDTVSEGFLLNVFFQLMLGVNI